MSDLRHLTTTDTITLRRNTPASDAVAVLLDSGLAALPVVEGGHYFGFVTVSSVLHNLSVNSYHCEGELDVADILQSPEPVNRAMVLPDLGERFARENLPALALVEGDQYLGTIYAERVLRMLQSHRETCSQV